MVDNERFTRHWTQAQPIVASYINSMVPDFHQAEDLLQNVAVVLLRKFEEYDPARPFAAWALGIAKREILAMRRTYARSCILHRPELVDSIAAVYEEMEPELKRSAAALGECMKQLKGGSWEMVRLRYEESLPPRDIATRLGLAAGNVRVLLSRIRASLLECLERRMSIEGGRS